MILNKMSPETADYQKQLANYCRSGGYPVKLPGVTPHRLHHYRRLVSNVIYDTLEKAFPITYKLLNDEWETLVDDFFSSHDCRSPQIWKLPDAFRLFLKENNYSNKLKKFYLDDLLYFEWIEIELHCMPDIEIPKHKSVENYLDDVLISNPEHKILGLQYPVHLTVNPKELLKKSTYFVLVYRDYDVRNVHFINLGYIPAICLSLMIDDGLSLRLSIAKIETTLNIQIATDQVNNLVSLFKNLKEQEFLLGSRI